jgi:hypothetical protein
MTNPIPWPRVFKLALAVALFLFFAAIPGLDETQRTLGMLAAFGAIVLA